MRSRTGTTSDKGAHMFRALLPAARLHPRLRSRLIAGGTTALRSMTRVIAARLRAARDVGMAAAGMSTAEYAIGTVAACAFAALLYKVVTSTQILDLLTGVVSRALHVPF
jgi:hypothetical protein